MSKIKEQFAREVMELILKYFKLYVEEENIKIPMNNEGVLYITNFIKSHLTDVEKILFDVEPDLNDLNKVVVRVKEGNNE